MTDENPWGAGYVRWKEYLSITASTVVAGSGLFAYVLSMAVANPHPNTVQRAELLEFKERLTRQEERHNATLNRIETKLDKALER